MYGLFLAVAPGGPLGLPQAVRAPKVPNIKVQSIVRCIALVQSYISTVIITRLEFLVNESKGNTQVLVFSTILYCDAG